MRRKESIDYHTHYTGALSPAYIQRQIAKQPRPSDSLEVFHLVDSGNWKKNYQEFFRLYELIQQATRFTNPDLMKSAYREGAADIAIQYLHEGVDEFQLRVGPKILSDDCLLRFQAMSKGFLEIETRFGLSKPIGKFVFTLIQNNDGAFVNVTPESLESVFEMIANHADIRDRLVGFDFSGPEAKRDFASINCYLAELQQYRKYFEEKYGRGLEIMVHAGEYIDSESWRTQMDRIQKLIDMGISRLSHGTLLWLDPTLVNENESIEVQKNQRELIRQLFLTRTHLELCPTANVLLSPLRDKHDIPIKQFNEMGLEYSINTDNRTLFDTTLAREMASIIE